MSVATTEEPAFPVCVFVRKRSIEREGGLVLAGLLYADVPRMKEPKQWINEFIHKVVAAAQAGALDDGEIVIGWQGRSKPANAVDLNDNAVMDPWRERTTHIDVRIDPRDLVTQH